MNTEQKIAQAKRELDYWIANDKTAFQECDEELLSVSATQITFWCEVLDELHSEASNES